MGKQKFSFMDRLAHYTDVASGKKPTKKNSKYTDEQQRIYAKGQRDAMNRQRGIFAFFKKLEKKNCLDEKPVISSKRKSFDDIYIESVGADYDSLTKGKFKGDFEQSYISVSENYKNKKRVPFGKSDYQYSKGRVADYTNYLKKGNYRDDNERDYLLKQIASDCGSMRAFEEKYNMKK